MYYIFIYIENPIIDVIILCFLLLIEEFKRSITITEILTISVALHSWSSKFPSILRTFFSNSFTAGSSSCKFFSFSFFWEYLYFTSCLRDTLGRHKTLNWYPCHQHFKNVILLLSVFQDFWWEICSHLKSCFSVSTISFFSAFKIFFLSLVLVQL